VRFLHKYGKNLRAAADPPPVPGKLFVTRLGDERVLLERRGLRPGAGDQLLFRFR
jgi:hypothetical protein